MKYQVWKIRRTKMDVATLIELLTGLAPELSTKDFVNIPSHSGGLLVKRLGVCVDPTVGTITSAVKQGVAILISYHPWHGEAKQLIRKTDLGIIPLHTAWDNAPEGVNLTFAREIGLTNITASKNIVTGEADLQFRVLLERCGHVVDKNIIPYFGELRTTVKKVGIWAGPGFLPFYKRVWEECAAQGCDTIISGELSLFPLRYATVRQLQLIDLGHSAIAKPAMANLVKLLKARSGPAVPVDFFGDCYGCNYYTNFCYAATEEPQEFISLFTRR
jgi:putative NIF3 family GTP cyclohydrolase 1 type 2